MKKLLLLLLFFVLIQSSFALTLNVEHQTLFQGEDQYAIICSDEDYDLTISCFDDDLINARWANNCNIYHIPTSNISCSNSQINARTNTQTRTQSFNIMNFESNLYNRLQETNNNPKDLALNVYGFSLLGYEDRVQENLDLLREIRIEEFKCFGGSTCNLELTLDVLRYLDYAGINRTSRVFQDAMLWIESKQNKDRYEDWHVYFSSGHNSTCQILRGDSTLETINFGPDNRSTTKTISFDTGEKLDFVCDSSYTVEVYNFFGDKILRKQKHEDEKTGFKIEPGCWNMPGSLFQCSPMLTGKALSISSINEDVKELGLNWIENNLDPAPISAERLFTTREIETNLYLYEASRNPEIRTWLWYSQNNNGSFGTTDQLSTTLKAIKIFEDKKQEEWIQDAISFAKNYTEWDNLKAEIINYELFRPSRSPIRAVPGIFTASAMSSELFSADTVNVNVTKTESLQNFELSYENRVISLEYTQDDDRLYTGFVEVYEENYERRIPVSYQRMPFASLEFEESYYFLEEEGIINIPLEKSNLDMTCEITFSSVFFDKNVTLVDQNSLSFEYEKNFGTKEEVEVRVICDAENNFVVEFEEQFIVRIYSEPPFSVSTSNIELINERPGEITIINNIDEELLITKRLRRDAEEYSVTPSLTIPIGYKALTYITKDLGATLNLPESNAVIISTLGFDEEVEFEIQLNEVIHDPKTPEISKNRGFPWLILVLVLIIAGGILYVFYAINKPVSSSKLKNKAEEKEISENKQESDKSTLDISTENKQQEEVEDKEDLGEILAAVDKALGEPQEKVQQDLKGQGFEDDEIKKILDELDKYTPK